MHELSIVQGILEIVERERIARGFKKVRSVELQCGHYSCVSEESLRFLFEAAATGPHLEGAAIELVRMPAMRICGACRAEFPAGVEGPSACPACGAAGAAPLVRTGVFLRSLEVE